jgi:ATP-dependent Clp protease ATP-binding subunit ClpA
MFERFTDRARRVLVLAQEEARILNHDFIGTEHILLGLLDEGEGVAAKVLTAAGLHAPAVRDKVEELLGPSKMRPSGSPPFTPRAKKVLELSLREALALQHSYIGTEHLLLGLLREGEGVAVAALVGLGVSAGHLRAEVIGAMAGHNPTTESAMVAATSLSNRLHILEGLQRALSQMGDVLAAVEGCAGRAAAVARLAEPPFELSQIQALHVLDLRVESVTEHRKADVDEEIEALRRRLDEAGKERGQEDPSPDPG